MTRVREHREEVAKIMPCTATIEANCDVFREYWDSNSELVPTSYKKGDHVTKKLV